MSRKRKVSNEEDGGEILPPGEDIIRQCLHSSTRMQYQTSNNVLARWLNMYHPEYLTSNNNEVDASHSESVSTPNYRLIKLPLPVDIVKSYLKAMTIKRDSNGNPVDPQQHNSVSYVNGARSAYIHLCKSTGVSDEMKAMLKDFMSGYKRIVAQFKEDGKMKMTEGKAPISIDGYTFLSKIAVTTTEDFSLHIMAHSFITLSWNLMTRATSTAAILYDHVSWKNDALVISFSRMKNDQEGRTIPPRHVYANPRNPCICPVLSLAIRVFTETSYTGKSRLLYGQNSQERFSRWLSCVVAKYPNEMRDLGVNSADIGTHSFRKGVSSYISNCPGRPQAVSVWLRAGWSLGSVQSRYIFQGSGGDQFVGRAAAGLDINAQEFAVLPPHFLNGVSTLSLQEWESVLPNYSIFYPPCFKMALPFLLASLLYHKSWIQKEFVKSHPIFQSRVWASGILDRMKDKVASGIMKNNTTRLTATGVPPNVMLANRLSVVEMRCASMESTMRNELPKLVCDAVLSNCNVNGATSISRSQLDESLSILHENLLNEIRAINSRHNQAIDDNTSTELSLHCWNGRLHCVPENYHFPRCSVVTLWQLWFEGVFSESIGPLRLLRPFSLVRDCDRVYLSKARKVISTIVSLANAGCDTEVAKLKAEERIKVYEKGLYEAMKTSFIHTPTNRTRALSEMSYSTMYRIITKGSQ